MKITKQRLKQIIKEELKNTIREGHGGGAYTPETWLDPFLENWIQGHPKEAKEIADLEKEYGGAWRYIRNYVEEQAVKENIESEVQEYPDEKEEINYWLDGVILDGLEEYEGVLADDYDDDGGFD